MQYHAIPYMHTMHCLCVYHLKTIGKRIIVMVAYAAMCTRNLRYRDVFFCISLLLMEVSASESELLFQNKISAVWVQPEVGAEQCVPFYRWTDCKALVPGSIIHSYHLHHPYPYFPNFSWSVTILMRISQMCILALSAGFLTGGIWGTLFLTQVFL